MAARAIPHDRGAIAERPKVQGPAGQEPSASFTGSPGPTHRSDWGRPGRSFTTVGMKRRLVLLAKYPRACRVKTRLAATVGDVEALRIYEELLRGTLRQAEGVGDVRQWHVDPPADVAIAEAWIASAGIDSDRWRIVAQSDGDLGQRIAAAACHREGDGGGGDLDAGDREGDRNTQSDDDHRTLIIGADCPGITAENLVDAWDRLRDADVVVGPTDDGGYWTIGFRGRWSGRHHGLIDAMPWSTDRVLPETIRRLRDGGLTFALLPQLWDVDDEADLARWRGMQTGGSSGCGGGHV